MKRFSILIVAVLVLSVLGAGMAGANQATPTSDVAPNQEDGLSIVIGTTDDISELDPANAYSFHDWEILRNTSDSLLGYVPGGVDIEPRLATDFPTVNDDGTVYTFTLRDDAMFPDGTVLTPELYVEWVNRSLTLQGDPFGLISVIESVEVGEGENEIVFTLSQPFGLFPITVASQPQLMPFSEGIFPANEFDNQPATISGVGPYQLVEYTIGEQAVFNKNPNYYGEPGAYDEVVFIYYEDDAQLTLAIESGEIDMAWRGVTATEVENLAAQENLTVIDVPGRIQYFLFNHESEIGGNPLIRSAVAKAIDRDEIIDRALSGLASPLYSFVPDGFAGSAESFLDLYGFRDLEGAIADLQEAGYSEDSQLELDLWYPPERYGGQVADAMAVVEQQLEETGLIDVTLQSQEWSSYIPAATGGEYPFFFLGWFFDYPDSDNYIDPFASCAGSPGLGVNYCTEEMDGLISDERAAEIGSDERADLLVQAQDLFAQEIVGIPLYLGQDQMVYDNTVVDNVLVGAPLLLEYRFLTPVE
jgi:peptide/nickel transport system substrate-binding protein